MTKSEFSPYFSKKGALLLQFPDQSTRDTLLPKSNRYQDFVRWTSINDKWLRGQQNTPDDIILSQPSSDFYLRFSETGQYVSIRGPFDKVSDGNEAAVNYYQEIEIGELNFLIHE